MIKTVEKNNIIADFQRGLGNKTIAKAHGHSRTTIIEFRKAYNEAMASDNPDAALTELIRQERVPSKRNRKHPKLTAAIRAIIDADLDDNVVIFNDKDSDLFPYRSYLDLKDSSFCHIQPDEDIVTKEWKDDWRIPTESEWEELISSSDLEWVELGVNTFGAKLTSRINGESIILPACGSKYRGTSNYDPNKALYWSSSYRFFTNPSWLSPTSICFCRFVSPSFKSFGPSDRFLDVLEFPIRPVFGKMPSDALKRIKVGELSKYLRLHNYY